jgi:KipI family sensor histidine kinase inhibitor
MADTDAHDRPPTLVPLGDRALLVRFAVALGPEANRRAIGLAQHLAADPPPGVVEIVPNLVSVLLRYDPASTGFTRLAGELRLRIDLASAVPAATASHAVSVRFGGENGPDLQAAADALGLSPAAFVAAHNATPLRVIATGFAPGFVYCGFHPDRLKLPRRKRIRPLVPPGTVLFAAGQTAVTATAIPTGWHVIGQADLRNFDAARSPPTSLRPGDLVHFAEAVP